MIYTPNELMSLELKYKDDYEITKMLNELKRLKKIESENKGLREEIEALEHHLSSVGK